VTEALISMQVEHQPWEEASDIEDPVAPPLEHVHAVVDPLDNAACLPIVEVMRDHVHPPLERPKEAVALDQPTGPHPRGPRPHRARGARVRIVAREWNRAMTISAHGPSSSSALTTPSSISIEGQFCRTWHAWDHRQQRCYTLHVTLPALSQGGNTFAFAVTDRWGRALYRRVPGNPEGH